MSVRSRGTDTNHDENDHDSSTRVSGSDPEEATERTATATCFAGSVLAGDAAAGAPEPERHPTDTTTEIPVDEEGTGGQS